MVVAGLAVILALLMLVASSSPAHASTTFTVNITDDVGDIKPGDGVCNSNLGGGDACTLRGPSRRRTTLTTPVPTPSTSTSAAPAGLRPSSRSRSCRQ